MTVVVKERSGERGNVLFLILIAVALFAALSYAVTQSTRSGSGDASSETSLINSAQLAQYPAGVRTAVVRMVIGGTSVDNLIFDAPANFSAISDLTYNVFHPTGGGAVFQVAPKDLLAPGETGEWIYSSRYQIDGIGITDSAQLSGNEVIAFLPGVSRDVCRKLNSEVGITSSNADGVPVTTDLGADPPTAAPVNTEGMTEAAPGAPGIGAYIATIGGGLAGQPFGCFRVGAVGPTATYVYYHVLVER